MKPNNNNVPIEGRSASRAISPSFRTGPRQRPSDASTDEIVRFVREYQRFKPSPPVHTISAMKTKAVLPSIDRKRSELSESQNKRISMLIEEESMRQSFESNNKMDIDSRYAATGMVGSRKEGLEQESNDEQNKSSSPYRNKNNDFENSGADSIGRSRYKYKDRYGEATQKRHSNYEISLDVDQLISRSNGVVTDTASHNRHKRGSVNTQTLYSHKNDPNSSAADQSFLQNNLARPAALRQLPPITNKETNTSVIPRPSAPSPNKASPVLDTDSDESCAEDDNDDDRGEDYNSFDIEELEENERGRVSPMYGAVNEIGNSSAICDDDNVDVGVAGSENHADFHPDIEEENDDSFSSDDDRPEYQ